MTEESMPNSSQREYQRMVEQVSDYALISLDLEGRVATWNLGAKNIKGYSNAEAVGLDFHRFYTPEDQRDGKPDRLLKQAALEGVARDEGWRVRKDGSRFWASVTLTALHDDDGKTIGFSKVTRDLSERREHELSLRRALTNLGNYQRMVEQVSDYALISLDLEGRVATWNLGAKNIKGYSNEEATGLDFHRFYTPEDQRDGKPDRLLKQAEVEGVARDEGWRVRKDGSRFWASVTLTALHDDDGKTIGFSKVTRDLTQMRHQQQLEKEKEAAIAAGRAKSAFLATMSHEIRTPMNAVIGFADLLTRTELNPQQRDYLRAIQSSGEHLLSVINNVLDHSKLEAGSVDLHRAPVDLRRLCESALDLVAARAQENNLELVYSLLPGVPLGLIADENRLRQVLVNILGNAVKFTPRGEVVLQVSARPLEADRWIYTFQVRDTGIGLGTVDVDSLFEDFKQSDSPEARKFGGTGLGLSISRRLVQAHGGRISARNALSGGSIFEIEIPAQAHESAVDQCQVSLRGRRLLVVDDNASNLDILSRQANSWGMEATGLASPRAALDWINSGHAVDIIVLDHDMPQMTGVDLAHRLRQVPRLRSTPIILLSSVTSYVRDDVFAATLTKPVKQSLLYDLLLDIDRKAAQPEPAETRATVSAHPKSALKILLAEDNPINRKLATLMIQQFGHPPPDVAENGVEAVEKACSNRYDVILMDVEMPECDGLEATRRITAQLGARRPVIIAMTAQALTGDRERCLAAGMDGYIPKPISRELLQKTLSDLVSTQSAAIPDPIVETQDPMLETLREAVGADGLREMAGVILNDSPPQIDALRAALATLDDVLIRRHAHRIKSTFGFLGRTDLSSRLQQMELSGAQTSDAALPVELDAAIRQLASAARVQGLHP